MSNNRFKKGKEKRDGGRFITIPESVFISAAYIQASPYGKMLLFDLFIQYKGDNNGDLCAAWKLMKPRGWRSEATLNKAKQELLRLGFIVETRKGARPNKASLYAVTWCDLDHCNGKLDMTTRSFPRGRYKLLNPLPAIKPKRNTALATPSVVVTS